MKVFVVTNPENGWDCVLGVYAASSEELLREYLLKEEGYTAEAPDWWEDCRMIHEEHLTKVDV